MSDQNEAIPNTNIFQTGRQVFKLLFFSRYIINFFFFLEAIAYHFHRILKMYLYELEIKNMDNCTLRPLSLDLQ